jgi:AraC-like DNA-binding protein
VPPIRSRWLQRSAGEIQCLTGLIQLREDYGIATAREFISRLPDPVTPVEECVLRGLLLDVCTLWAVTAHRGSHAGAMPTCGFQADLLIHRAWHERHSHRAPAKRVFLQWASRYFRALHRAHPLPMHIAAKWILAHSRDRVNDAIVARAMGIHVVELRKRFPAAYGICPREYVQRLRLADVMRLLADGNHNVRSALYAAGWRSAKSLYAAAVTITGLPFDRLRALPRDEWERRLALPNARRKCEIGNSCACRASHPPRLTTAIAPVEVTQCTR